MGYKCSVVNCTSGYASSARDKKISFFAFPHNPDLREKWTRACYRENFRPTAYSRICSLHFHEKDFVIQSTDCVTSRRLKHPILKQRKLKMGVIPSLYPNLPPRFETKVPSRTVAATSTTRLNEENKRIEMKNAEFFNRDVCIDFEDLISKVKTETLPTGYASVFHKKYVIFLLLSNINSNDIQTQVDASVKVADDLDFVIFINGVKVSNPKVQHLLQRKSISSVTELLNILAFVKSATERPKTRDPDSLYRFVEDFDVSPDDHFLKFVIEQLKIHACSKMSRRYAPNLVIQSFIWHSISPALYRKLRDLFHLPSERRLQQLSMSSRVCLNEMNLNYIDFCTKALTQQERIVSLIIDEIYIASRIEYHNGNFIGMTEEGKVGKTVLAFMAESITSKYRDVVKLIAVDSLTSEKLHDYFSTILSLLDPYLFVLTVVVDNHAVNR